MPARVRLHTSAAPGHFRPYPVSNVALTPADMNFYLTRGSSFDVGVAASAPFGPLPPLSAGCPATVPPPCDFCATQPCPPLTQASGDECVPIDMPRRP
jgi:hypothetical protein